MSGRQKRALAGGLTKAPAEALPLVPREGLSLSALFTFAEQHAGRAYTLQPVSSSGAAAPSVTLRFEQLTTAQVCAAVVMPATHAGGVGGTHCTYAELLLAQVRVGGRALRRKGAAEGCWCAPCALTPLTHLA